MTETVVNVTTLEQWKSVLDVWFAQGYKWQDGTDSYHEGYFVAGQRYLKLYGESEILQGNMDLSPYDQYSEFMAQQKEDNKMATVYEVSQSVFDELQRIKNHEGTSLVGAVAVNAKYIKSIEVGNKAILRYLADDPAIEFKTKEQLYRLYHRDATNRKWFFINWESRTQITGMAFKAPLEEIKKWQTPAWKIEKDE